jgi:FkbM family methyltransferase
MNNPILTFEECLRDRHSFELASVRAAKAVYIGEGIALCRVANRFKMYVPTRDLSVAPHLMIDGYWESWITIAFSSLVRLVAPSTVVNVGANLGYYTLMAAALLPASKVIAYEPQPQLAEFISRSAIVGGFGNIIVNNRALGSLPGSAWLRKFDDFYGSAMVTSGVAGVGVAAISVEINTLDLESNSPLEFLIIDAEGFEFEILKGAENRFRSSEKTVIVLEFSASRYSDKHNFVDWISAVGFDAYKITYDGLINPITLDSLHDAESVVDLVLTRGFPIGYFDSLGAAA